LKKPSATGKKKERNQNLIGCENNSTGRRGRDERWGGHVG
jgi:hypothetical protein